MVNTILGSEYNLLKGSEQKKAEKVKKSQAVLHDRSTQFMPRGDREWGSKDWLIEGINVYGEMKGRKV